MEKEKVVDLEEEATVEHIQQEIMNGKTATSTQGTPTIHTPVEAEETMEAEVEETKEPDVEVTITTDADAAMINTITEVTTITKQTMMVTTTKTRAITARTVIRIRDLAITETTNHITTRVLRELDGITMQISPIMDHDNQMPLSRI